MWRVTSQYDRMKKLRCLLLPASCHRLRGTFIHIHHCQDILHYYYPQTCVGRQVFATDGTRAPVHQ